MKAIGVKIICERADGEITTWRDVFETTIEDVINKMKQTKRWVGGKITEVYLDYETDGKYYKIHIDVSKMGFNELLKT